MSFVNIPANMVVCFRFVHVFLLICSGLLIDGAWGQNLRKVVTEEKSHLRGGRQLSNAKVAGRIIGGSEEQSKNRYPYYVSLVSYDYRHICGGSLIGPDIVLTAAHCNGSLKYAIIGQYNAARKFQNEIIPIKSSHPHELFGTDDAGLSYDQMVIILKRQSNTTTYVKVNLDSNIPTSNDVITVIGFGVTEDGELSNTLKYMDGSYVPNDECSDEISGGMIDTDMVCIRGNDDSRQCRGDSGGPWIIRDTSSENSPLNDLQIATVSWGVKGCVEGKPGVGSRTSATDLITQVSCAESQNPPAYFGCPTPAETAVARENPAAVATASPSLKPTSAPSITPSESAVMIQVNLFFDPFPQETSWSIVDTQNNQTYVDVPTGTYVDVDHAKEEVYLSPGNEYEFRLVDTAGDGIMGYGHEYLLQLIDDGVTIELVKGGGEFGAEKAELFYVPTRDQYPTEAPINPSAPTLSLAPTVYTVPVHLSILFGKWHEETYWKIVDADDESIVFAEVVPGHYKYGETITETINLPPGRTYILIMYDYFGDGLDSDGYRLWTEQGGNVTLAEGDGNFASEIRHTFALDPV